MARQSVAAHKPFNYLRYQSHEPSQNTYRLSAGSSWLIALAYLWADDAVNPIQPKSGSLWNKRGEATRIPHMHKRLTERLMGNADPRENFGHICCSWFMTDQDWPDKLVLRSGWNPGDFSALVELHPTSFPANPGGIKGLNRWGAPFTQIVTSKGASVENRALIQDLARPKGICLASARDYCEDAAPQPHAVDGLPSSEGLSGRGHLAWPRAREFRLLSGG